MYGQIIFTGTGTSCGIPYLSCLTNPDPRNRQSVAVHLMSLCATFELGLASGARAVVQTASVVTLDGLALEGRVSVDGTTVYERRWLR